MNAYYIEAIENQKANRICAVGSCVGFLVLLLALTALVYWLSGIEVTLFSTCQNVQGGDVCVTRLI